MKNEKINAPQEGEIKDEFSFVEPFDGTTYEKY